MDVKVKRFDPVVVAAVRHVGPYDACEKAWDTLMADDRVQKEMTPDTRCIGLCYDNPKAVPAEELRYDACIPVPEGFVFQPPVARCVISGGPYAVVLHEGDHSELPGVYEKIYEEWIPENGRQERPEPAVEIYLRDSEQATPPGELKTEVRVPLAVMETEEEPVPEVDDKDMPASPV